jgi:uncharacterized membrane protein
MLPILNLAQIIGEQLDLLGVLVIVGGVFYCFINAVIQLVKNKTDLYKPFRQNLGRSILLGLEFLVAGDIIRSVTGTPSFTSVGVLIIVVLVRSFLSMTFEMEIEGHWPWDKKDSKKD